MKRTVYLFITLLIFSGCAITDDNVLYTIGDKVITTEDVAEEVALVQKNNDFQKSVGADVKEYSATEIEQGLVEIALLNEQFEMYNITLTEDEQDYVNNYLTKYENMAKDATHGGDEAFELLNNYLKSTGLTRDEYNLVLIEQLTLEMKYVKLLEKEYDGDREAMEKSTKESAKAYIIENSK